MNYDLSGSKSYEQIIAEQILKEKQINDEIKRREEEKNILREKINKEYKDFFKNKVFELISNENKNLELENEYQNKGTLFGYKIDKRLKLNENKILDIIERKRKISNKLGNFLLNIDDNLIKKYFTDSNKSINLNDFFIYVDDSILLNLIIKKDFYNLIDENSKKNMKSNSSSFIIDSLLEENIIEKNTSEHKKWRDIFSKNNIAS